MKKAEKRTIRKQWNYGADCWSDFVDTKKDSGKPIIAPAIMNLLPAKRKKKETVLDLCCGEGYYSRILRKMGYETYGVDISDRFIELARKKDARIAYRRADAARMKFFRKNFFDLIVCSMALIDTPDLNGTLKEVGRILKPGGYFLASISHPCYDRPMVGAWARDDKGNKIHFKVDNYSRESGVTMKWNMQRLIYPFETLTYHRTLSTYVNGLIAHGLGIDGISEPYKDASGKIHQEEFRVPNFMIIRARKS
jgi:SAM-dependent methyltransferase